MSQTKNGSDLDAATAAVQKSAYEKVWPPPPKEEFVSIGPCRRTGKDITICYNTFGNRSDPCILLVMGLGCAAPYWDSRFCAMLAKSGFYVIRFDNRDSGLSTHFDELKAPFIFRLAVPRWLSPFEGRTPYYIDDMADDAVRLLDALHIRQASVVGCSLGGAIAQSLTIRYPERVRSLCLLSTSSGVPLPEPRAVLGLLDHATDSSTESIVDYKTRYFRTLAGRLPFPVEEFRVGIRWTVERCPYEDGKGRQLTALVRSPDRSAPLRQLNALYRSQVPPQGRGLLSIARELNAWLSQRLFPPPAAAVAAQAAALAAEQRERAFIPVVVLHGGSDPIIPPSNAEKLARLITGAKCVIFPEMGHYFPASLFEPLAQEIILTAQHGEALAKQRGESC